MGKKSDFQKSCEVELSTAGVDRFVKTFDYIDQEWTEIELSAQPARAGPLTEEVRQCLRQAAVLYLTLCPTGRQFLKQQEQTVVENWACIYGLAAELYEKLGEANARRVDKKYERFLNSLAKLRHDASILSSAKRTSLPPREDYYREILGVWVDKLGGRLGVSRDSDNHKLGGPLVRFFQAVTGPVLATEAPARESISGIVDRERKRRKERRKGGRQAPARMALSLKEPAPSSDASGYYTDLGSFPADPDIPFERQVHDYIIGRGRITGNLHIVAVDADGTVFAHGYGRHNCVVLPEKLADALRNPAAKIVIHINRMSNAKLDFSDIALLANPGLEAVWGHGNGDSVARAALTTEARSMLRGNTIEEATSRLFRIACGVELPLFEVLHDAIDAGRISRDRADAVYSHLICLTLRRAGILDYWLESTPGSGSRRNRRA